MSLTPDFAIAVARPLRVSASVVHGRGGGEADTSHVDGDLLAIGWDRDRSFGSPDRRVLLVLDDATRRLCWVREDDVLDIVHPGRSERMHANLR
jgi:hypothetical protein